MRINYLSETAHNEWYTPPHIVEACRSVLGGIDFDPFSSDRANEVVKASHYLTASDDALVAPWVAGRCFVNPPYQRGVIGPSIARTIAHLDDRTTSTGIVLVNVATDTTWFQALLENAAAVCFLRKRLKFVDGVGGSVKGNGNTRAQALFYFGYDVERFATIFDGAGAVIFL